MISNKSHRDLQVEVDLYQIALEAAAESAICKYSTRNKILNENNISQRPFFNPTRRSRV